MEAPSPQTQSSGKPNWPCSGCNIPCVVKNKCWALTSSLSQAGFACWLPQQTLHHWYPKEFRMVLIPEALSIKKLKGTNPFYCSGKVKSLSVLLRYFWGWSLASLSKLQMHNIDLHSVQAPSQYRISCFFGCSESLISLTFAKVSLTLLGNVLEHISICQSCLQTRQ